MWSSSFPSFPSVWFLAAQGGIVDSLQKQTKVGATSHPHRSAEFIPLESTFVGNCGMNSALLSCSGGCCGAGGKLRPMKVTKIFLT
jgi:hypothetical protein